MCVGFESLIRWTRNGGVVSPATFIPIAEECAPHGVAWPVGTPTGSRHVRRLAAAISDAGLDCITVNVSSRQLIQQNFARVIQHAVHSAGLKPADLRVEITETRSDGQPG